MGLKNSQYDELMRDYERRRFRHLHERDERTGEVLRAVPAIREIDDLILSASGKLAEQRILGGTAGTDGIRENISTLRLRRKKLLTEAGFPEDYLDLRYDCPVCRDTGYVGSEKCRCFKQAAIDLLYARSGVRDLVQTENFDRLSMDYYSKTDCHPKTGESVYDHMTKVIGQLRDYAKHFGERGGDLLFTGATGSGKTYLSNCIAKELMDQGFSVVYLTAEELFDIFSKAAFSREEEAETDVDQYLLDCDLLIIDDLGTEFTNNFTVTKLFYCINERHSRGGSTLISTNLSIRELADLYSERVSSRLIGYYTMIPFFGEDIRVRKKITETRRS